VAAGRWEKLEEANQEIMPHTRLIQWPLEVKADKWAVDTAAACVFMNSENVEEAVKHYGVDRNKCFVVESGVNPQLFKPIDPEEAEKSRRDIGFDQYDKIILNNGYMVERKNIHLLIEALHYLPSNYKLLLVGPSETTYQQKLHETQKKFNVEDRIVRVGYTPYPQNPIAYQVANIFVLPSEWEGMPKVIMQSLATGVPSLASGFKLDKEISGLEYLENLDPQYIAQKIFEIVETPPQVDSQKVISLYSWDARALELEKVYEYAKTHYL
jgi:glycosyltransferase involved in cell wall biosynthesis